MSFIFSILSSAIVINSMASGVTIVKVDPSLIEYFEDATGQEFTVAIKIIDVTNLYGFDLKFRWNTTFLDYVSHSVRVPKDTYPDGVLWNPIIPIQDTIDTSAGTYWIAYSSRWPAPSFNGSGTVFTMTFRVKYHPVEPEPTANITLELYSTDLVDKAAGPIPHTRQHGIVILHALAARHDVAVIDVRPTLLGRTIAYRGLNFKTNVTIQNQGNFTETFNVTLYANTTVIGNQSVTLTSGMTQTIILVWTVPTNFPKGNYTLKATASIVTGEIDIADNTCVDSMILVTIVDFNGDKKCNILDLVKLAGQFGQTVPPGDPKYDLDCNGKINILDLVICARFFGTTDP